MRSRGQATALAQVAREGADAPVKFTLLKLAEIHVAVEPSKDTCA